MRDKLSVTADTLLTHRTSLLSSVTPTSYNLAIPWGPLHQHEFFFIILYFLNKPIYGFRTVAPRFKKLFGTEFNKELLIDFLNQVLGDKERIQDLTYLNTENLGNTETDRKAIFDLYCENEKGEKFIIELQNVKQQYFKDRGCRAEAFFTQLFPYRAKLQKAKNGIII